MQRITLTALLLTLTLIVSINANAKMWFEGGTLHQATYAQWNNATYANKLATSGDWLAATIWKGHVNSGDDFERLKVKAGMLARALDKVTTVEGTGSLKVAEIATMTIMLANDLGP